VFGRKDRRRTREKREARSIARLAREGAGHDVWIHEALRKLRAVAAVDRCGIWLEGLAGDAPRAGEPPVFRGELLEIADGYPSGEWTLLSLASHLPLEPLSSGKTVEFRQNENSNLPIAGPAMGMRRGLWVPVLAGRTLCGVVLAAACAEETPLPKNVFEEVAEELGFALEWEKQNLLAGERQEDLELSARFHARIAGEADAQCLLQELAENCTGRNAHGGMGAVFALIGERRGGFAVEAPSAAGAEERLEIRAHSGETAWAHSLAHGPLEMFWRRAVESGEMVGAEPTALPLARDIARVVAFPLAYEGAVHGVLLAGLPRGRTHAENLERLERRALLAGEVLQQQSRRADRAQLEQWRHAFLAASDRPVLLLDRHGFLRGISRGAGEILGRAAPALPTRGESDQPRFAELFRPRDWERAGRWLQEPAPPDAPEEPEEPLRMELKDGHPLECRRLDLGSQEFIAVELKPAQPFPRERTREDVETELRQTVGWMEEGVVLFDESGRVRAANERFHRLLGITAEETFEAQTFEDLLRLAAPHAHDPERFARDWRELADAPQGETQEELQMSWPVPQAIERCTREIIGANGRHLGRVEVYREMTARRMFQSRMAQTEKLASMGQRVSSIVHELSNPLTTILGYAQRLLPRVAASSAGMAGEVRGILGEAERAAGVLRQLLRVSGEAHGVREPLSLNELVDRTVGVLRATLAGSPIRLVVEKEPSLARVQGDFGQLQQVLLNLLQNAQQAIEQSGKGGLIGVRTAGAGEGRVRLEVWDDGPGIPGAILARIFDPFFTTKPPGVGTGLGLAIVLGFVRQHGGTVNVISPPRGGTRFLVELPALRPAEKPLAREPEVIRFPPRRRLQGVDAPGEQRAAKVLVVEDEPTVGGLIADVLRDEGMRVDVLRDGQAALARTEHETYDLVICDLRMPGMDGKKFFQSLGQRQNPLQEHVLFVTGDVVAPGTQEFLERHRLPYVAKPFRVEELSRAVHEML